MLIAASSELTLSGLPGVLPMHDVIYCVRLGYGRHSELKKAIQNIRLAGGNPLGIVLWDDIDPALIAPAAVEAGVQPQRTAEMEALVGGRGR